MPQLRISIITVASNAAATIGDCLSSVASQDYGAVEVIVVDGASTDATLSIVTSFGEHVDRVLSEPDRGIGDAMNKGLALASGEYILFLHADDYLISPDAISRVVAAIGKNPVADIHAFGLDFLSGDIPNRRMARGFSWWMNFKSRILHQAVFCSRTLFDRLGGFDTDFRIAMDYDFFLRAYRAGAVLERHDDVVAVMRDTGISSRKDVTSLADRFAEERIVHRRHCKSGGMSFLYSCYWPLYLRYRGLRDFGRMDALLTGR